MKVILTNSSLVFKKNKLKAKKIVTFTVEAGHSGAIIESTGLVVTESDTLVIECDWNVITSIGVLQYNGGKRIATIGKSTGEKYTTTNVSASNLALKAEVFSSLAGTSTFIVKVYGE